MTEVVQDSVNSTNNQLEAQQTNPEAVSETSINLENEKLYSKISTFDNIRPLPKSMEEKFEIRAYLVSKANRKALKEGKWAKFKRKRQEKLKERAKKLANMKERFKKFLPWQSTLDEISCRFGNITRSYFDFIQCLTILNFVVGIYLIYMTTMVMFDSTMMEYAGEPATKTSRFGNSSDIFKNQNLTSFKENMNKRFEQFKHGIGYRLHPFYHYFGIEEFYDVTFEDFVEQLHSENETANQLPFIHKFDEFVFDNFDGPKKFKSDITNLTLSRSFNKTCYIQTNNIDSLKIDKIKSTMSSILTGEGTYIEHGPVYYSYYQPIVNDKNITNNSFEHTKFAAEYLVTFLIAFLGLLIYLTLRSIRNVQSAVAKNMNTNSSIYTENTFLAWDFSMTQKSAGELKKEALLGQLVEDLEADEKQNTVPCKLLCCCPDKFRVFMNQVFRVILFSVFCGYVVFTVWAISSSVKFKRKNINNPDHPIFEKLKQYKINLFPFVPILPQLTLSIVTGAGPAISKILSGLGNFSDEQNFMNSILGTTVIKLIGILLFIINMIAPLQCNFPGFFGSVINEENTHYFQGQSKFNLFLAKFGVDVPSNKSTTFYEGSGVGFTPEIEIYNSAGEQIYNNDCMNCENDGGCWETNFAKEIYVLVMVEGVIEFLKFLTVERLRSLIANTINPKAAENLPGVKGKIFRLLPKLKQQFEMMEYVMELVTMQCFTWIAMFYCPVLPMILCFRLAVTFSVKKIALFEYCQPPRRYRFRNSDFFYQILLLFYCFAVSISVLLIANAVPSYYCGPLALHHSLEMDPTERKITSILKHYIEHDSDSYSIFNIFFRKTYSGDLNHLC